jgi:hypothetical protein
MAEILRQGARGPKVKFLQIRLNASGLATQKLDVDGVFGSRTKAAVQSFQTKHGLIADGVVGPKTWRALGLEAAKRAAPPNVQKFVHQLGTVDDFVGHVRKLEASTPSSKADLMLNLRDFSGTSDNRRYLIVRKSRISIIDFRHFFAAASEAYVKGNPTPLGGRRGDTLLLGLGNEVAQCIDEVTRQQLNSCFSPEDLMSNRFGAEFGRLVTIRMAENSPKPVSELLAGYLHGLDPQSVQSVQRVKLPSKPGILLEAITAVLIGIYDWIIPDAY